MAISKSANGKSWRARIKNKLTGTWDTSTHDSRAKAVAWETSKRDEINKGTYQSDDLSRKTTLASYLEDYLKDRSDLNPTDVGVLKHIKSGFLGRKKLSQIHIEDVQKWVEERCKSVKPNTAQREMKVLSAVFNGVVKKRGYYLATNPCKGLTYPDYDDSRDRLMSLLEEEWILKAIDSEKRYAQEFKALFLLLSKSAPRVGSCLKTKWKEVSLEERVIRMPPAITKNGKPWNVVMPMVVRDAIQAIKPEEVDSEELVFGHIWKAASAVNHRWKKTLVKANTLYQADCVEQGKKPVKGFLVGLRVHDLRHTAITNLYKKYRNLSMFEIMKLAGHLDVASHQRYANVRIDQEVVDMIA